MGKIGALSVKITDLGYQIGNKTEARKIEFDKYVAADKDVTEAIDACEAAIAALKGARDDMEGHVQISGFAQLRRVALLALSFASSPSVDMTSKQWKTLAQLSQ